MLQAFFRLASYVLWTFLALAAYLPIRAVGQDSRRIVGVYWRTTQKIIGLDPALHGSLSADRPLLVVSNHISYLDIVVLSGVIDGFFVAKSDVARWPGIGFLARIARTVFIDRKKGSVASQRDALAARMGEGLPLVLFPEGTSSDGNRVLPFKSALFSVVETAQTDAPIWVQPVTIAYTRMNGLPVGRGLRDIFAWYGDMELASHLWAFLKMGRTRVEVIFHEPVSLARFGSRKALASHCRDVIAHGLDLAHTGHFYDPRPKPIRPEAARSASQDRSAPQDTLRLEPGPDIG